jgi:uncharacterized protein YbjT (DUF2867 family)
VFRSTYAACMRIGITGGTGFVGGHLATALSRGGHEVVLTARGVDQRPWASEVQSLPNVSLLQAGLDDVAALQDAFAGCDAVAHCAGINREVEDATYQAVHVEGTANVVRAAELAGVKRLTIVSFLRARPNSGSSYHESKWAAEELVRSSNLDWTVLKPGMMYGRGDHMLDHLSKALATFPVYIGVGDRRVRPLAIDDAVRVLEAALVEGRLSRMTVPLLGPTELSFDQVAELVARVIGKRRLFIRAPIAFHYLLARITEATMTVPLVATAQVRILQEGLVEPTLAPDSLPEDLEPVVPFDEEAVRRGLPDELERFGRSDLRLRSRSSHGYVVCGQGEAVIHRPPEAVLEFVLDVDQYRKADLKVGPVRWVQRDGERGLVKHGGRLLGIPTPPVTLSFELTPYSRLDFEGKAVPWPMRGFSGFFICDPSPDGTKVVHRECFIFGPISGRLFKLVFRPWLSRDTPAEVLRMKRLLESQV